MRGTSRKKLSNFVLYTLLLLFHLKLTLLANTVFLSSYVCLAVTHRRCGAGKCHVTGPWKEPKIAQCDVWREPPPIPPLARQWWRCNFWINFLNSNRWEFIPSEKGTVWRTEFDEEQVKWTRIDRVKHCTPSGTWVTTTLIGTNAHKKRQPNQTASPILIRTAIVCRRPYPVTAVLLPRDRLLVEVVLWTRNGAKAAFSSTGPIVRLGIWLSTKWEKKTGR